jgi:hypothetical protein
MLEIRYYVAANGDQPFADWFAELEAAARAQVTRSVARMEQGNFSNVSRLARACSSIGSMSGPAIVSTSGATAKSW